MFTKYLEISTSIIIPVGGGDIRQFETLFINEYIVSLAEKKKPNVLFIPTASSDSRRYIKSFRNIYHKKLRCMVRVLFLVRAKYNYKKIESLIKWADIIYVGGGNTRKMIKIWRDNKVDFLLHNYKNENKIYSGLSAGAICWFESGISDYEKNVSGLVEWKYKITDGIGILKGTLCPHYNERKAEERFNTSFQNSKIKFIGIDNNCAIHYVKNSINKIIKSGEMNVYNVEIDGNNLQEKIIS
jgi:dipeptidase E